MLWRTKTAGETKARALVQPFADFFLIGGLSLLTLIVIWALTGGVFDFKIEDPAHWWAYYAAYAVNYPHFAYSYMLFYPGFLKRLTGKETEPVNKARLWVAGIVVPLLMFAYFAYAWYTTDAQLLGWAAFAMVFTVGWHYVKQGYGTLITMSVYKNVFYHTWEKRILYVNAYAVWVYTWARLNWLAGDQSYYDVHYTTFAYPDWFIKALLGFSWLTTAASAVVLLKHWLYDKKGISFNAVAGYTAAIYLWVMLPFMNMTFYVFIPLFHSLQYYPFVFKFKKSEYLRDSQAPEGDVVKTRRRARLSLAAFAVGGYVLGALFFVGIPEFADKTLGCYHLGAYTRCLDQKFFLISFLVFINIHHFFIDSAFWRRDNKAVQQFLFKA